MKIIPEGDMYRLITHSKLESAERFESWVFDEVLPSLRKTGSYEVLKAREKNEHLVSVNNAVKNLKMVLDFCPTQCIIELCPTKERRSKCHQEPADQQIIPDQIS